MTEVIVPYLKDDIELQRGGDWHETITVYEDDGVTPKDTTDWTLTMIITKSANGEELDRLETDGTRIINTPASGQFNLNLTAAEVDAYPWQAAIFRLVLEYDTGDKQIVRMGAVRVV